MAALHLLFLLCLPILFGGCSQSEPRIQAATLRLVYGGAGEGPEERFTFMVAPEDDDGIEDLAELHLVHDREQLYWTLEEGDWIRAEQGGRTWIGSHGIAMPDGAALPRGGYRAVLVDKSGARTERILGFDAPVQPRYPFPSLSIEGERYRVSSEYPKNLLVLYDVQGGRLRTVNLAEKSGTLQQLNLPQAARSAALWAEDDERQVAAFTSAQPLRR